MHDGPAKATLLRFIVQLFTIALLLPVLPAHAQETPGRTAVASVAPVFLQARFQTPDNVTDDCFYLHVGPGTLLSDGDLRLNGCATVVQPGCLYCGPSAGTPVRSGDAREKQNATRVIPLRLVYIDWNGNNTRDFNEPLFLTTGQGPRLAPTSGPDNVTLRLDVYHGPESSHVGEWDWEVRSGVAVHPLALSVTYLDNDADSAYTDEDLLLFLAGTGPGVPAGSPPPLGALKGLNAYDTVQTTSFAAPTLSAPPAAFQVLQLERGRAGDVFDNCFYLAPGSGATVLPVGAIRLMPCSSESPIDYYRPAFATVLSSDESEAGAAVTSHETWFRYADSNRNGRLDRLDKLFVSTNPQALCRGSFSTTDFTIQVGRYDGVFHGHRCSFEFSGTAWVNLPAPRLGWADQDATGCISSADSLYLLFRDPLPGGGIPLQSLRLRSEGLAPGTLVTMRAAVEPASTPVRQTWDGVALCPRHVVETRTMTTTSTMTATQTVTESSTTTHTATTTQTATQTHTLPPETQTVTQTVTQGQGSGAVQPQGEVSKPSPGVTVLLLAVLAICVHLVRRRL